jgi:DNA polymerase (family 10)
MTNKEIARAFQLLGEIMELHEADPFKVRSYQNAYIQLRKLDTPLEGMPEEAIGQIKGVGKAIAGKIHELLQTGTMATLERYKAVTPQGIQEMLQVKGFGPKKVRAVWKGLGVETIGELLYAINENRLVELKGFGLKTQEALCKQLEYYQASRGLFLYAAAEQEATVLLSTLAAHLPGMRVESTGAYRRKSPVLDAIDILIGGGERLLPEMLEGPLTGVVQVPDGGFSGASPAGLPVRMQVCPQHQFGTGQFRLSAAPDFLEAFQQSFPAVLNNNLAEEGEAFEKAGLPFIAPELREAAWPLRSALRGELPVLIEESDIYGVIHAHSTWSDGLHTLREMATACIEAGFTYLLISDHSKSAFYANGLSEARIALQFAEIDALNLELAPFRIFKGIECDILNDGTLDYPDEILAGFDCVIASVHSNLKMDMEKATARLIRAVEHPSTRILGHPTGRLLLSRPGYPVDHHKVIDACIANGVVLELNANPYRLDLDWQWLPYALERGAMISVNPDAHSIGGITDIRYGIFAARKGGLSKASCLNAKDAAGFRAWIGER